MTKDQILKIAKIKSVSEFYKLFPDEESFKAKYGKELKKLELGANMLSPRGGGQLQVPFNSELEHMDLYTGTGGTPQSTFIGESAGPYDPKHPTMVTDNAGVPNVGNSPMNWKGIGDTVNKYAGPAGELVEGFQALKAEKQQLASARQWRDVSDVVLDASRTRPEQQQRRYVRPEDMVESSGMGVGTNVLGKYGLAIPKAANGFMGALGQFGEEGGGDIASQLITSIGGRNAGGQIGGTIGGTVGGMFGPAGQVIGQVGGQIIGGLIDRNPARIKAANAEMQQNVGNMTMSNGVRGLQGQYAPYMEYGGNLEMDGDLQTYEGGYAEPISQNPYLPSGGQTVMFRGKSHEEGGIPVTYGKNPVEVESGEPAVKLQDDKGSENLVVFGNLNIPKGFIDDPKAKGKKFKNYIADLSKMEVSQNKLLDNTMKKLSELEVVDSLDKLSLASFKANVTGANMKLKALADKKERAGRLQQAINDTAEEQGIVADDLAKGKIKKARMGANVAKEGVTEGPVDNAEYRSLIFKAFPDEQGWTPAERQTAYDIMIRESGGNPKAAPINNNKSLTNPEGQYWNSTDSGLFQINSASHPEVYKGGDVFDPEYNVMSAAKIALGDKKAGRDPFGQWTSYKNSNPSPTPPPPPPPGYGVPPVGMSKLVQSGLPSSKDNLQPMQYYQPEESEKRQSNFLSILNQILPYVRPSDAQPLNPNQLAGEMFALSNNQLEPVSAQGYHPHLSDPYDISLQDIRNENQADYRATQRMVGGNPAMQAILNAQKYEANQKVGADEFRMNQAQKDKVFTENRNLLNDAQLKNLGINDQQYTRQTEAKSNTKATIQAALNSISDKYAKNSLENKTLQTYENLYTYRYDAHGRAINMNGIPQWNIKGNYNRAEEAPVAEGRQYPYTTDKAGITAKSRTKSTSRNGSIVRAMKGL